MQTQGAVLTSIGTPRSHPWDACSWRRTGSMSFRVSASAPAATSNARGNQPPEEPGRGGADYGRPGQLPHQARLISGSRGGRAVRSAGHRWRPLTTATARPAAARRMVSRPGCGAQDTPARLSPASGRPGATDLHCPARLGRRRPVLTPLADIVLETGSMYSVESLVRATGQGCGR